jgi:hypothetical protein
MINVRDFTIISSIWLLAACSAPSGALQEDAVSHIRPEPEVLTVAEEAGFDYMGNLRRAEKGEAEAIVALINFSPQTDAAASLAHGWVLLNLRKMIGSDKFANALARATNAGRKSALNSMEVAGTYE